MIPYRHCWPAVVLVLATASGCTRSGAGWRLGLPATQPATNVQQQDLALFAPLPAPEGFDPVKARQPLDEIPDDPPAPMRTAAAATQPTPQAQRHLQEAHRLFDEQRFTETISELEKALRYEPTNPDAHRAMAMACLLSGNEARARLSAERALAIRNDDLPSHFVMARFADKSGKTEEALRHYRLALKSRAGASEQSYRTLTHYYLGVLLFDRGYYAAAARQLQDFETGLTALGEQALDNPALASVARVQRPAAAIRAARASAFLGQYAAAADSLKFAAAQLPKDVELRTELVRMLVRARRIDEAVRESSQLVVDTKGSRPAIELLLAVHRFAGHPDRGLATIRELVMQQPGSPELRLVYADALLGSGKKTEAVQALVDFLNQQPAAREIRWKLVHLHRSEAEWDSWLAALAGLLAAEPAEYVSVGAELDRVPKAQAQRLVSRGPGPDSPAAATQPGDALASAQDYLLARLNDQLDRLDDAQALFERAIRRTPDFLPAAIGTAEMYVHRCRWQEAVTAVQAARQSRQTPAHQLERLLGQAYDGLDDIDEAVAHYEKAVQLNPADARSLLLLGRLHERTGQGARAQKAYEAAVGVDPADMGARELLVKVLLARLGVADQQNQLARVIAELNEMQRRAKDDPASIRCVALFKYLTTREREGYEAVLRQLVQTHPQDMRSHEDLAKALFEFRKYDALRSEVSEMLVLDPCSATAHELLASLFIKTVAYDQAREQLNRMLKLYPNRQDWLRQVIELRLVERDPQGAIDACMRLMQTKSIQGKPERELAYRFKLMQCYHEASQFETMRRTALDWLKEPKLDPAVRQRYRAFVLAADAASGNHEHYLSDCRTWLQADPTPDVQRWLLLGLIQQGRGDEALLKATAWLADKPTEAARFDGMLDIFLEAGRVDSAIELVRNQIAAAEKPEEKQARPGLLISAYLRGKRYAAAAEAVKELLGQKQRSDEDTFELRKMLARIYAQADRYDDALDVVNELLSGLSSDLQKLTSAGANAQTRSMAQTFANNRRADLLKLQSGIHQKSGDLDRAMQRLSEAYRLTPEDVGVNNDYGYMLADSGHDLDRAAQMVRFALGEDPRQVAYLDSYGWVLYKQGEFSAAVQWLTRASEPTFSNVEDYVGHVLLNPAEVKTGQDAVILDHLGDARWRTGEHASAIKTWQLSLQVYRRQVANGEENADPETMKNVEAKLAAASAGGKPAVAASAADTQPAD